MAVIKMTILVNELECKRGYSRLNFHHVLSILMLAAIAVLSEFLLLVLFLPLLAALADACFFLLPRMFERTPATIS